MKAILYWVVLVATFALSGYTCSTGEVSGGGGSDNEDCEVINIDGDNGDTTCIK